MDPVALKPNTFIDEGESGFTLTSNKPTFKAGTLSSIPPIGFLNPPLDFDKYLSRHFFRQSNTFSGTTTSNSFVINNTFLTQLTNFSGINTIANGSIYPTALKFRFIVHSTYNTNGLIAFYFDPAGDWDGYLNNELETGTNVNAAMVKACNLGAAFVSLAQAREVELIVPLTYPTNIPSVMPYIYGHVRMEVVSGPYYGTGVNSFNVESYVAPIGALMHPLDGA